MKIAFFTENNFNGKISLPNHNLRTDLAWIYLLDADNININTVLTANISTGHYDLGIIIIPKNRVDIHFGNIQMMCKKVAIMQEGPCTYWTDYVLADQFKYLELLSKADFLLCHNTSDIPYYKGLVEKSVHVLPSVMVEESISHIQKLPKDHRAGAMIGGNMCSWYGGMSSFIVANNFSDKIFAPSMGRKIPGEEHIQGLTHLPYMNWVHWMQSLNEFAIGVHMMPTVAAGTFSLNCAYFGIPCIGNEKLDTQKHLHRQLSIDVNNIVGANKLAIRLKESETFYNSSIEQTLELYDELFHSRHFVQTTNDIFEMEGI